MLKVEVKHPEHVIIKVDDQKIVITRKGVNSFFNRGGGGDHVIPMSTVTGVDFKEAGITGGQIKFSTIGGEKKSGGLGSLPPFNGSIYNNENGIIFRKKHNKEMEQIKDFVESKLLSKNENKSNSNLSVVNELKKLKDLLDEGAITESEFNQVKSKLLSQ